MARQIELALVSQASWAFLECHSLLNQFLQYRHLKSSAIWSPLQLIHLNEWEQGKPCAVSRQGGFNFGLALQHHAKSLWCSSLWEPLYFWYFNLWALHKKVECPHFQQLWHWGMPGFMLVTLTVAMYLPRLNEWLISFALEPFWLSQISNYMIAILDLGKALIILGLVAKEMFSKRLMYFMKLVMFLLVILLPSDHK